MRRASTPVLALPLLLAPLGGCPVEPEGEVVGTFAVVGELRENTCGETAFAAIDPIEFDVELRLDADHRAYWRRAETSLASGTESDGAYRFRMRSFVQIREPNATTGDPGCGLVQTETVTFELEAEADEAMDAGVAMDAGGGTSNGEASLSGANTIQLTVASGSDCSALLAASGGQFVALPCAVEYQIEGRERSPIF